ncbi:MAG TPA: YraN family protein [Actinomycetota bacterium]|nr:YraN family protein [Actinomycetota bacterium]
MDARIPFGRSGEDIAARSYEREGYCILARNYRRRGGEIDLVAARGSTLVVCEVKTRRTDFFGDPAEAVTPLKQARLRRLAAAWLAENPRWGSELRFDVVSIVVDREGARVTRLEDAF